MWGVKRIYGVVGDAIIGLMDEMAKQDTIQFIAVKHESVAAMMASAEAKLTGRLGVCLATMGPGLGNLLNGLDDAYSDKVPVLAITGQAPTQKIGTDYKQYIDQKELIKPLAEYTTLVTHQNSVTDLLVKAMNTSLIKGAVSHLSIPKDLFEMNSTAKIHSEAKMIQGQSLIDKKELEEVVAVMKTAKKPMILAGVGAKYSIGDIEALAKLWGAGILVSLGQKDSSMISFLCTNYKVQLIYSSAVFYSCIHKPYRTVPGTVRQTSIRHVLRITLSDEGGHQ